MMEFAKTDEEGNVQGNLTEKGDGPVETGIPIGIYDDPKLVRQGLFYLNYQRGHHLICGMPRCGKSTLLATYLDGLLEAKDADVELYILDYGGGRLSLYAGCSSVVRYLSEQNSEEAVEVLTDLAAGLMMGASGRPMRLIIIDGLDHLMGTVGYKLQGPVSELLQHGNAGIMVLATAGEISPSGVNRTWLSYMSVSICMKQKDVYQYGEILSVNGWKPEGLRTGQAYGFVGESVVKVQIVNQKGGEGNDLCGSVGGGTAGCQFYGE